MDANQRKVSKGKTHQSCLQAQGFSENEESLQLLLRWTSAFCKVLMWHVREHCDLESELQVSQPIACCQLPVAYCLLPIACCLLPVAYCRLPIAGCLLPVAYCLLPVACCLLPVACCLLPVACCLSLLA